jgi:hypothetical protein
LLLTKKRGPLATRTLEIRRRRSYRFQVDFDSNQITDFRREGVKKSCHGGYHTLGVLAPTQDEPQRSLALKFMAVPVESVHEGGDLDLRSLLPANGDQSEFTGTDEG